MADATGILSKMGIKDVATWETAYAAVDELIPFVSETLVQNFTRGEDESLVGSAGRQPSDQLVQSCEGQTVHKLDYNNFDSILETFFGAVAARVFTLSEDTLPKQQWIEFDKQVTRWRFGASKISKIVIQGEKDGHVMLTVDWMARDVARTGTAFPAISTPGARTLVRFEDLDFWVSTIAAGPPGAGDRLRIESFELELDRVLVGDDYGSKDGASGEKLPIEPVPNGFRNIMLKVKQPRYASDADFVTWKDSNTPIQAKMTFTRGSETIVIDLPDLRLTEGADAQIGGPERIQQDGITMEVRKPESTNPLYTGNEVRITVT